MTDGDASTREPTVLRTNTSAVLLDRSGEIALAREARGAVAEWGGVYGQLVRLTGPWRTELRAGSARSTLPATLTGASVDGDRFESHHRFAGADVTQTIVPVDAGALRSLRFRATSDAVRLTLCTVIEPYLLPVLVEGIRPVSFEVEARPRALRVRHRGYELALRGHGPAALYALNGAAWTGERRAGPVSTVGLEEEVDLAPGKDVEVRYELTGGIERDEELREKRRAVPLPDPDQVAAELAAENVAWEATTPELSFPDAPELEAGYRLARTALRRLYTEPGDSITGLLAGFPWYAAVWCRDVAWMVPAVAWLGDLEWAERTVSSVLRFQSAANLPVVGGEVGELPMQIAPGPVFFYGTSDTTLYFAALAARLARHGTADATIDRWRPALERTLRWAEKRTDPATGLVRNGGEAAELAAATQSLARIRYGIDAVDTTIWDSTDRRDHAVDVQVLWHDALVAAAELGLPAGPLGPPAALAERLAATLRGRYGWDAEGYLYDSWRAGAPVAKLRPNALRVVSAGLLAPEQARAVVARAAKDDLTTPWGVRTLSSLDPGFSPEAYHDGQVWPIATAWAADAALATGSVGLGVGYLGTVARALIAEGGQANECYRGDRGEPFDSCFLLGLSVGPFVTTVFERLWGITLDARRPSLEVRPLFPPDWHAASIRRLRVGSGRADLAVEDGRLSVAWQGNRLLKLRTPGGSAELAAGERATLALAPPGGDR